MLDSSTRLRAPRVGSGILVTSLLILLITGCGGKSGLASPQTYGDRTEQIPSAAAATPEGTNDQEQSETQDADKASRAASSASDDSTTKGNPQYAEPGSAKKTIPAPPADIPPSQERVDWAHYHGDVDSDDSASAVDDDIWRQLDLAEEYHAMGVIANREGSWEEGQYYFEEALRILAALDIEPDSLETPEATKYTIALENIIADYRVTLRSLGHLDKDVSSSATLERLGDPGERNGADSMYASGRQENVISYD